LVVEPIWCVFAPHARLRLTPAAGLLPWSDNDVLNEVSNRRARMDNANHDKQQALSINTWLVLKGLVRRRQEQIAELKAAGKEEEIIDLPLPAIPYVRLVSNPTAKPNFPHSGNVVHR